ncbi:N-acyl-D-aspartate/D-glutamate deacylase [Sphingomonas laterariae]|uniref:N-acyl-D-aspartate/D-glutamate deacylase n=1 Tax=Edaphosphingomonas laterariae TaxID=861865 RepID=A0A239HBS0_9SPHN|nr:amidohydrolase family protein [Sphingomonas laterariae]SNS78732.1 N-acyl-D-aspartate/D-glutamate deacylase [Sphingomonas laterariae]
MSLDLIIRNARVCDGSGGPSFTGDVGVRGGRIVAVGEVSGDAAEVVDAKGLVVAPGFIDPHTHYDAQLVWDGLAQPSLEHGITTIVPGNCSLSLAPLRAEHRELLGATFRKIEEMPKNAFDAGLTWKWETFGEYVDAIRGGLGINVAPAVGHSLIRLWVMGDDARERAATDDEIAAMQEALRECLRAGAIGMSGSWVDIDHENRPVPARLAEPKELDALCAVLGEFGAILQIVPEFWDADLLCARIDILADLSRKHGISTTFSPLFDSNAAPELCGIALERIKLQTAHGARVVPQMQTRPIDLSFDLTAPMSTFATLPSWWATTLMPHDQKLAALRDPEHRAKLKAEIEHFMMPIGLQIDFADAFVKRPGPNSKHLEGRTIRDIAAERGCHIAEAIIDVALEDDLQTSYGLEALGHNDTAKIANFLAEPLIGIGAGDGGAHVTNFSTYGDTGYLFSQYVRGHKTLSVEQAVHKLTWDIANLWGIKDRGLLKPGYAADLVIFDPAAIDRGPEISVDDLPADGFRYIRRAAGIEQVFVNGRRAYSRDGGYTEARTGAIVPMAA